MRLRYRHLITGKRRVQVAATKNRVQDPAIIKQRKGAFEFPPIKNKEMARLSATHFKTEKIRVQVLAFKNSKKRSCKARLLKLKEKAHLSSRPFETKGALKFPPFKKQRILTIDFPPLQKRPIFIRGGFSRKRVLALSIVFSCFNVLRLGGTFLVDIFERDAFIFVSCFRCSEICRKSDVPYSFFETFL